VVEELLLLKYYQAKLQHICQELRFPRKVLGTAVQYLKRLYLAHSPLEHDPQYLVITCLYLACKVGPTRGGKQRWLSGCSWALFLRSSSG
jgi:cyclin H